MSTGVRVDRAQQPNNFDFLRLGLAVLVLYSHCYPLGTGSESNEPIHRLTNGQITGGAIAVDLFFVMSGFLITASVERSRALADYFRKRVVRIYPAFIMAALFDAIVVLPHSDGSFRAPRFWGKFADFALQTLRLREFNYVGAFPHNPYAYALNGSLWSIQFESWCYVGVSLLLVLGLLQRRLLLLVVFLGSVVNGILFQACGWVFGGKWLGVLLGSPQLWARLLPFYLAGVVFYLWRDRIRYNGLVAALVVSLLLAACWLPFGWTSLFPAAGAYLIFFLAFSPQLKLHHFGRFGDFSYGTYLYAFPLEQLLMKHFGGSMAPATLFLCALPLTILIAAASWYGVERHFLRPDRRKELPLI